MNLVKKAATSLLETAFAKTGHVLSIKTWHDDSFFEVDVYLPDLAMDRWTSVPHIKVKVAEGVYRDYSPALWDAAANHCTLFINATQEGHGSHWVRTLKAGDEFIHLGAGASSHKPSGAGKMICLGDSSTIGHFLALQQLSPERKLSGAITVKGERYRKHLEACISPWNVSIIHQTDSGGSLALTHWIHSQHLSDETIYIAGHIETCIQLRKTIKAISSFRGKIKVQGFWQ